MNLTFLTAVISILVGLMCGAGEGHHHSSGFAIGGGIIGTGIGLAGAWLAYWFEGKGVSDRWGKLMGCLGSLVWVARPFWIPLLVGVAAVFSVAGLVRLIG